MSGPIIDRECSVQGDNIIRNLDSGHVEVFSDTSGVTITAASGNISFKDEYVTGWINFSESGEVDLQTVNGRNSIIGVLNQVGLFYVSSNDTTADYAENKLVATSGITITVLNEGGNEQLQFAIDPSGVADLIEPYIEHNGLAGLQGGVSGQYYHLTSQQFIDLTSGLSADNQHYHNASAIVVDDTNFDIISGTDLQTVLDVIDEALKTRNTLLVNFDIGGSIRNGNTQLGFDCTNGISYVGFRDDKVGTMFLHARVPENYIPGTALTFTFKWYSVGSNTDNVRWQLTYKGLDDGENINTAGTTAASTVAEPGVAGQIVETTFAISSSAFQLGDVMIFELQRLGDDALDTSTEDSRIIEVSLDY